MKYKITNESKIINWITVYRIEALKSFWNIKKWEKGGFIEKENNLSHNWTAWIRGEACVYWNASVYWDARIYWNASVCWEACVSWNACVYWGTSVCWNARVCEYDIRF